MRGLELHVAVTLERELGPASPLAAGDLEARELTAEELDRVLAGAGLLVERAAGIGRPPWRAFVVSCGPRPVHHSFVTLEQPVPRLFKVFTHPEHRRRGAFALAAAAAARALAADGHRVLESSCNRDNRASIAAHLSAGFRPVRTTYHPYVLGVPLRPLARRVREAWRRYR